MKNLSVIIPTFNEEEIIESSIASVRLYLADKGIDYEIIVVDDGSTDNTLQVLEKIDRIKVVALNANYQKGKALKEGIRLAKFEHCLLIDADLSIPITELEPFLNGLESDITIASKYLNRDIKNQRSFKRNFIGKVFSKLVTVLLGLNYSDTQCGFKILNTQSILPLLEKSKINNLVFDIELLLLAKEHGLTIKEFPVNYVPRPKGTKLNVIKSGLNMLGTVIQLRFRRKNSTNTAQEVPTN